MPPKAWCAQDERQDHCFFCGEEIPCLIRGQNVCKQCWEASNYCDEDAY